MEDPVLALPSPTRAGAHRAERRGPRARGRGHGRFERYRAHRFRTAAFRRHVYRRGGPRAGVPARRGQAQRVSRGAEIETGAGAPGEYGKMNHLSEEQLILYYYGENGDDAAPATPSPPSSHLEECERLPRALRIASARAQRSGFRCPCRSAPPTTARRCGSASSSVSARGAAASGRFPLPWRWAAAGAAFAALLVAAFLAGRLYPRHNQPAQMAAADPQAGERVLLVAVGDYLERSQMVLIELSQRQSQRLRWISPPSRSAPATSSPKRGLYRQTAAHTGDTAHGRRTRRTRARAGGHLPTRLPTMTPEPIARNCASGWRRRHSLQDPRAGLQRPEPGSSGRAGAPPDTLKGKGTWTILEP